MSVPLQSLHQTHLHVRSFSVPLRSTPFHCDSSRCNFSLHSSLHPNFHSNWFDQCLCHSNLHIKSVPSSDHTPVRSIPFRSKSMPLEFPLQSPTPTSNPLSTSFDFESPHQIHFQIKSYSVLFHFAPFPASNPIVFHSFRHSLQFMD